MTAQAAFDGQITFLYASGADWPASVRFYGETLGLALALDQGACRIYRTAPGAYVGVCRRDRDASPAARAHADRAAGGGVILTLLTPDVDGWYERLRGAGVTFAAPPAAHPAFGIYHCFARDPAGYLVEIQRFDDPRWSG